jgi:hypothetical protein
MVSGGDEQQRKFNSTGSGTSSPTLSSALSLFAGAIEGWGDYQQLKAKQQEEKKEQSHCFGGWTTKEA